jgi:hypothetical protein
MFWTQTLSILRNVGPTLPLLASENDLSGFDFEGSYAANSVSP